MLFNPKGKGQRGLQARPGEKDAAEFSRYLWVYYLIFGRLRSGHGNHSRY